MSVACFPSAECDELHDAKKLFDITGFLCSIFFGIPLALVLLRIIGNLSDSVGRIGYMQMGLQRDIIYTIILIAAILIPSAYTYFRYRSKAEMLYNQPPG